jgi:hypothetical protein
MKQRIYTSVGWFSLRDLKGNRVASRSRVIESTTENKRTASEGWSIQASSRPNPIFLIQRVDHTHARIIDQNEASYSEPMLIEDAMRLLNEIQKRPNHPGVVHSPRSNSV